MGCYIDPWNKVLRYPDRLAAIRNGERVYPLNVEFDLTNRCNLHCQHCDFAHVHDGAMMEEELAERAIRECADVGVKALTLTGGGEPTLHPRFADLCQRAYDLGMAVGVYSNGLRREALVAAAPHLAWAYISLDEVDPRSYWRRKGINAWWTVCANVQAIAGKTVVGAGFLLHGENYRQASKMVDVARDLGADYCQFRPVVGLDDYAWVPDCLTVLGALDDPFIYVSYRRFEDLHRSACGEYVRQYSACRGSVLVPCIGADGTVWVCPNTRGLRPLGNLKEETLRDIWARRPAQYVGADCRVACRNDALNETLEYVCSDAEHMAFV